MHLPSCDHNSENILLLMWGFYPEKRMRLRFVKYRRFAC